MLGNHRVAAQVVASRVVLSSTELVSDLQNIYVKSVWGYAWMSAVIWLSRHVMNCNICIRPLGPVHWYCAVRTFNTKCHSAPSHCLQTSTELSRRALLHVEPHSHLPRGSTHWQEGSTEGPEQADPSVPVLVTQILQAGLIDRQNKTKQKQTPCPLVRERTIPTERPPLVDEI
jgi:hypothetical protein